MKLGGVDLNSITWNQVCVVFIWFRGFAIFEAGFDLILIEVGITKLHGISLGSC
jgi:hypothetical protein